MIISKEDLISCLAMMAARKLAGRSDVLRSLYDYVHGRYDANGVSRTTVKGAYSRIAGKIGSYRLADLVIKKYALRIAEANVESIIERRGDLVKCRVCRKYIAGKPEDHIYKNHRDLIIETIRSAIKSRSTSASSEQDLQIVHR